MTTTEPQGCLTFLLRSLGLSVLLKRWSSAAPRWPYRCRDDFLSSAELAFYRALASGVGTRAVVICKVNLNDLFFVVRGPRWAVFHNKISRKHIDFVLCDPLTMTPRCGVELDDSSHDRSDRRERDTFVNRLFADAGLPLVRVRTRSRYEPAELQELVAPYLGVAVPAPRLSPPNTASSAPMCPKCGVAMVPRIAKKGTQAGESFFGCPHFPKCREVLPC